VIELNILAIKDAEKNCHFSYVRFVKWHRVH